MEVVTLQTTSMLQILILSTGKINTKRLALIVEKYLLISRGLIFLDSLKLVLRGGKLLFIHI